MNNLNNKEYMTGDAAVGKDYAATILLPYEPELFWRMVRQIIREELTNAEKQKATNRGYETPGMTYKPLYKIAEVCALFHVTKPTIYDWVRHGKLKPYKIRSRVYFLWQDIQQLLHPDQQETIKLANAAQAA